MNLQLLPDVLGSVVQEVVLAPSLAVLIAVSTTDTAACPCCGTQCAYDHWRRTRLVDNMPHAPRPGALR